MLVLPIYRGGVKVRVIDFPTETSKNGIQLKLRNFIIVNFRCTILTSLIIIVFVVIVIYIYFILRRIRVLLFDIDKVIR